MNEYKVTFRGSVMGFFTQRTVEEVKIFQAKDAQEALKKAEKFIKTDPEYSRVSSRSGVSITVADITKL